MPLSAVAGYDPSFRIAARRGGKIVLFEAGCAAGARVGADLLDIQGRVTRIAVHARERPGVPLLATITDATEVRRLVDLVLAAPVDPLLTLILSTPEPGPTYHVVFHLADGTAALRPFLPSVGELWRGTAVPPGFGAAIAAAAGDSASTATPTTG